MNRNEKRRTALKEYEFTLRFNAARVRIASSLWTDMLAETGCDDATIGVGIPGRLGMMFARKAESAENAVLSAVRDVRTALPEARLVEAAPDLVGISEIADIVGKSRQNIRKLLLSCNSATPLPVHEGSSSIWHLAYVLEWLRDEKQYAIADELLEVANVNMQLNAAISRIIVDARIRDDVEEYLAEA
ncbi:MAG: DNA-binding protein [Coriobacteriia bacterium]